MSLTKKLLIILLLTGCSSDDSEDQLLQLCGLNSSNAPTGGCEGNFITKLKATKGTLRFQEPLGYYIEFTPDGTFDCIIYGVLCEDYESLVGSSFFVSGDIYSYDKEFQAPISGLSLYSIVNPQFSN